MKIYKPNALALSALFIPLALMMPLMLLLDPPYTMSQLQGGLGFSAMFILMLILFLSFRIIITDDNRLKYHQFFLFKKNIKIMDIYRIDRTSDIYGSQMFVYYRDEDKNKSFRINENPFTKRVIAKFVTELKNINSNIKLSSYYQRINDNPKNTHFSDLSKNRKIGILGAVASMIIFFLILETESYFIPVVAASMLFFLALFVTAKVKKAIIAVVAVFLFFVLLGLVNYIK